MADSIESGAVPEGHESESLPVPRKPCIGTGTHHPNAALIQKELHNMMRSPFRRMLADYLGFAPTPEALARFADKSPDRWLQGLTLLAQLAGFTKDVKIQHEFNLGSASDGELNERLAAVRQRHAEMLASRKIDPVSRGTNARQTGKAPGNSSPTPAKGQDVRDANTSFSAERDRSSRLNNEDVIDVEVREVQDKPSDPAI